MSCYKEGSKKLLYHNLSYRAFFYFKGESSMIKIKKSELKKYDGSNKNPAYIAYKGYIYDVTNSFLWKGGRWKL